MSMPVNNDGRIQGTNDVRSPQRPRSATPNEQTAELVRANKPVVPKNETKTSPKEEPKTKELKTKKTGMLSSIIHAVSPKKTETPKQPAVSSSSGLTREEINEMRAVEQIKNALKSDSMDLTDDNIRGYITTAVNGGRFKDEEMKQAITDHKDSLMKAVSEGFTFSNKNFFNNNAQKPLIQFAYICLEHGVKFSENESEHLAFIVYLKKSAEKFLDVDALKALHNNGLRDKNFMELYDDAVGSK